MLAPRTLNGLLDLAAIPATDIPARALAMARIVKRSRTGLEAKFSYNIVAAMTLRGVDTASDTVYTDALRSDPALTSIWPKATVADDEALGDTGALVRIEWGHGRSAEFAHDLATRLPTDAVERGLRAKAAALIGAKAAETVWSTLAGLEARSARDLGAILRVEA